MRHYHTNTVVHTLCTKEPAAVNHVLPSIHGFGRVTYVMQHGRSGE
jgi:hypothetical protein